MKTNLGNIKLPICLCTHTHTHTFTVCLQLLENDEEMKQTHLKCVTENVITLSDPLFKLQQEVTRVGF